jgi:Spy/CpxP family protein refolding chaperone
MTPSNPKRRRYGIISAAAALVAIAGGALAFAHSGGMHHGGMMSEQGVEMHMEHMQAMLTRIGASDAQKSQIEGILKPALEDMKAAHESHAAAFGQFHEALLAPSIDRAKIESLRAEQIKSLDEASKRLVTAISDAAEVLSPDQRAALGEEIKKHHGG